MIFQGIEPMGETLLGDEEETYCWQIHMCKSVLVSGLASTKVRIKKEDLDQHSRSSFKLNKPKLISLNVGHRRAGT